jgi:hypothetical protein
MPRLNRPHRASATAAVTITLAAVIALTSACSSTPQTAATLPTGTPTATVATNVQLPRPEHLVVVVMENHSYSSIIGSGSAPYINALAARGASFTHSYAVTHPSEPNYLALFSGTTEGLQDDSCPHTYTGPNIASELTAAGLSFAGYSESMPQNGYTGCGVGEYARKHNPWANFTNVPASDNLTFEAFPGDYTKLPTVSFVIPNLTDDMHDGTIAQGDAWLRTNIDPYARWAANHNSELIVTWDEDDNSSADQIPTIIVGAHVRPGTYSGQITHYSVLRTIESFYHLPAAAESAAVAPISEVFGS